MCVLVLLFSFGGPTHRATCKFCHYIHANLKADQFGLALPRCIGKGDSLDSIHYPQVSLATLLMRLQKCAR